MARKSVAGFRPKGVPVGERFYTDANVDSIITAAGGLPAGDVELHLPDHDTGTLVPQRVDRRTALGHRLESAARYWEVERQWQTKPTHRQRAKEFQKIKTAAVRLLKGLQVGKDGDIDAMPNALRYGGLQAHAAIEAEALGGEPEWTGEGLFADSIAGVVRLHRWAAAARERAEALIPRDGPGGHTGDAALDNLFGSLAGIWLDIFERTPSTCVAPIEKQPGGPFLRFLRACLEPLGVNPTDEALRDHVRKLFLDKARRSGKSKPKKIRFPHFDRGLETD